MRFINNIYKPDHFFRLEAIDIYKPDHVSRLKIVQRKLLETQTYLGKLRNSGIRFEITSPVATKIFSVENLKKIGMVGLYFLD